MKILKNYKVPTGNILVTKGDKGKLELLSIGDYGKNKNIKADFLGFTDEIEGVPHGELKPLKEKWVITLSSQYGCSMNCTFCDVPKVGKGINATYSDLKNQVISGLKQHPEVKATKRLNIHYARMGEPSFNQNVIDFTYDLRKTIRPYIGRSLVHPVYTTMMPKNNDKLYKRLNEWTIDIKNNHYRGHAGLQISINSTNKKQRKEMFNGNALSLKEISKIADDLPFPKGRKYALNFALADNYKIDAKKLRKLFNPEKFIVKITPLHKTESCQKNNIKTTDGYDSFTPYKKVEESLKREGFDVIVFIPSYQEDEGRITCGNAILSGAKPECEYELEQN